MNPKKKIQNQKAKVKKVKIPRSKNQSQKTKISKQKANRKAE
jgi:hypothetical protein